MTSDISLSLTNDNTVFTMAHCNSHWHNVIIVRVQSLNKNKNLHMSLIGAVEGIINSLTQYPPVAPPTLSMYRACTHTSNVHGLHPHYQCTGLFCINYQSLWKFVSFVKLLSSTVTFLTERTLSTCGYTASKCPCFDLATRKFPLKKKNFA